MELAAHLGHPPALRALRQDAPADWLEGLGRWGKQVQVRAAIAAGRSAFPEPVKGLEAVEAALVAAEAWLRDPSEANRVGARLACDDLEIFQPTLFHVPLADELIFQSELVIRALEAVAELRPGGVDHHLRKIRDEAEPETRAAMRAALLAWALGGAG